MDVKHGSLAATRLVNPPCSFPLESQIQLCCVCVLSVYGLPLLSCWFYQESGQASQLAPQAHRMFWIPRMYGTEFFILPLLAPLYFYFIAAFSTPAALINSCLVTMVMGALALRQSSSLAKRIRGTRDRLEPMWPALAGIVLMFIAALELILAVTHMSYYRKGPLITSIFEY